MSIFAVERNQLGNNVSTGGEYRRIVARLIHNLTHGLRRHRLDQANCDILPAPTMAPPRAARRISCVLAVTQDYGSRNLTPLLDAVIQPMLQRINAGMRHVVIQFQIIGRIEMIDNEGENLFILRPNQTVTHGSFAAALCAGAGESFEFAVAVVCSSIEFVPEFRREVITYEFRGVKCSRTGAAYVMRIA
jgi:hypothetical protein